VAVQRSVAGVAIRDRKIFVAQRKAGGSMGERWEFPGGKVEAGERDEDALVREFQEELELSITVGPLIGKTSFVHNGVMRELYAYEVSFSGEPSSLHEHLQVRWVSLPELNTLRFADSDGKIVGAIVSYLEKKP